MIKALRPAGFFSIVLVYFLLLFGISVVASRSDLNVDTDSEQFLSSFKILQTAGVILVFVLPALVFSILFSNEKLHYFSLNKAPSLTFMTLSVLMIIVALPMISYLEMINKSITLPTSLSNLEAWMKASEAKAQLVEDALMKEQGLRNLVINIFVMAFMAAFSEELFFRGLLQRSLHNLSKNPHLAVWITAILFSAFHLQFYGFIPRVILGAILGYVYVWSGSLWTNIIVHFINNAFILIISYLVNTGHIPRTIEKIGMDGDMVSPAWALTGTILSVSLLLLLYKLKKPVRIV